LTLPTAAVNATAVGERNYMSYASSIRRTIDQLKSSEDIEEILKMAKGEALWAALSDDEEQLDHWVEVCDVAEEVLEAPSLQSSMPSYALAA
jgi:hypothetical protein